MKILFSAILSSFIILSATGTASAYDEVIRDQFGKKIGTVERDSRGNITYRDSLGRKIGTGETDSRGNITYRDSTGRKIGTAETDSQGRTTYRDSMGRKTKSLSR